MNILLVAATAFEIAAFAESDGAVLPGNVRLHVCITGVGLMAATYKLTESIGKHRPDFVLQVGIAGAFPHSGFSPGDMVFVARELIGDCGTEDGNLFLDVFDMGLVAADSFPFNQKYIINPMEGLAAKIDLPKVAGLTVHTVSGSEKTAERRAEKYQADVESMEGAALHYVCRQQHIPFAQVRCISNMVERRDKSKWEIEKALRRLNDWLSAFLQKAINED